MMLGRLFDPKDKGLLLTLVHGPDGKPVAVCQFVPSPAINGYSLDLMRRDPGEHPNGLIDYALCSTIEHLRDPGRRRASASTSRRSARCSTASAARAPSPASNAGPSSACRGSCPSSRCGPSTRSTTRRGCRATSSTPPPRASSRWSPRSCAPSRSPNSRCSGASSSTTPRTRPGTIVPDEILEAAKLVDGVTRR